MYRIKEAFKNKTRTFKNRIGATIYFNGYRDYTQDQLEKMCMQDIFEEMIEWVDGLDGDKPRVEVVETHLNITFAEDDDEEDEADSDEEIFERVNTNIVLEDNQDEIPEPESDYSELTLKELRVLFPNIKATSKAEFLKQI